MASITKRGQKWHIRFYSRARSPKEAIVSYPVELYTRAEIKRKRVELEHKWHNGDFDPWVDPHPGKGEVASRSGAGVGGAVERYIEAKREAGERGERGGWSEKTTSGTAPNLRAFADHVGWNRPLAGIGTADVQSYIYSKADLRPSTRGTYRRFVRAFLRWAAEKGMIEKAPDMPPPIETTEDVPLYATRQEMRAICKEHVRRWEKAPRRARPLQITEQFRFAFYQGWRRQEIVALRRRHINFRAGTLALHSADASAKSGRFTEVPLTQPAREILLPLAKGLGAADFIFEYRNEEGLTRAFKKASDVAVPAKPRLHLHSLRHSCAVYWRKIGMGREAIQDLLGHKDLASTAIYESIQAGDLGAHFDEAYKRSKEL